jgi:putative addiction module killer protein
LVVVEEYIDRSGQDRLGPGYRIYFGQESELLVILVGGGTKKRQATDIAAAKERWAE